MTIQLKMDNEYVAPGECVHDRRPSKCVWPLLRKGLALVLLVAAVGSLVSMSCPAAIRLAGRHSPPGSVNWDKFTHYAYSVVNGRHFGWKSAYDQIHNRWRVDAVKMIVSDGETDVSEDAMNAVKAMLSGEAESTHHPKIAGPPVTMLFYGGGIYAVFSKNGTPHCRHYEHGLWRRLIHPLPDFHLPELNPLDDAIENGLTYAHGMALANHYHDVKWPMHAGEHVKVLNRYVRACVHVFKQHFNRSELWVDAFSEKPMAAKVDAEYTKKTGETVEMHGVHHFWKWMNYVDESHLTPPKQLTGVCREVGHSDAAAAFADDDLEDFEEFLAGVLMV
ncbi:MAG: hypothetical protein SGCHY_004244 [Lobulomycetales sp.]